jgi:hypothetical protein
MNLLEPVKGFDGFMLLKQKCPRRRGKDLIESEAMTEEHFVKGAG